MSENEIIPLKSLEKVLLKNLFWAVKLKGIISRYKINGEGITDGFKYKYKNGYFHNDYGPAIESGRFKCWYKNGLPHRRGAPAVEYENGHKEWWLDGEMYSIEEYIIASNKGGLL